MGERSCRRVFGGDGVADVDGALALRLVSRLSHLVHSSRRATATTAHARRERARMQLAMPRKEAFGRCLCWSLNRAGLELAIVWAPFSRPVFFWFSPEIPNPVDDEASNPAQPASADPTTSQSQVSAFPLVPFFC
jgi:hypothetical protein